MKNDKKKLIIVLSVVISVVIIGVASFIVYSNTPEQRIIRQLNLGNRYLSDLEYESAIACFETVITIDPQIADAYSGLIDCYEGLMDPDGLMNVYSDANSVLDESGKGLITGETVDAYVTMISEATSDGNYDFAGELISYLEIIDADKAQTQLTELNNNMCSVLGHVWVEATCTDPRFCTRCGATEGDALGHAPTEADLWNSSVCAVCGEQLSGPLTPYFVKHGLYSMHLNVPYIYSHSESYNQKISGTAEVVAYDIFPGGDWYWRSDEDPINFPIKDGYEWRIVHLHVKMPEVDYRHTVFWLTEMDYYIGTSESAEEAGYTYEIKQEGTANISMEHIITTYNNQIMEYDSILYGFGLCDDESRYDGFRLIYAACVPVGYDGCVIVLKEHSYNGAGVDKWFFQLADL